MSQVNEERVLVVPTAEFRRVGYFQGFCADADRYLAELLQPAKVSYRRRAEMEQDPSFKQLIPYVLFLYRDAQGVEHLFQYTRGKGQGEGRLHSKRSVGIGGHISSDDAQLAGDDPYREGLRRELAEEVHVDATVTERCVGLINDDETDVGKVHLGVAHVFEVDRPAVRPRETELIECGFRPVEQLLGEIERMESWSQICLRALFVDTVASR